MAGTVPGYRSPGQGMRIQSLNGRVDLRRSPRRPAFFLADEDGAMVNGKRWFAHEIIPHTTGNRAG